MSRSLRELGKVLFAAFVEDFKTLHVLSRDLTLCLI